LKDVGNNIVVGKNGVDAKPVIACYSVQNTKIYLKNTRIYIQKMDINLKVKLFTFALVS
jgi:hypothetical protein